MDDEFIQAHKDAITKETALLIPFGTILRNRASAAIWIVTGHERALVHACLQGSAKDVIVFQRSTLDEKFERVSIADVLHENALHRAAQVSFENQIGDLQLVIAGLEAKLKLPMTPAKKWEYKKVCKMNGLDMEEVVTLADEGWELVTANASTGDPDLMIYWFKREVQSG